MFTTAIEEQLLTIKKASQKAGQSEQSAKAFLLRAGLIETTSPKSIKAAPKK